MRHQRTACCGLHSGKISLLRDTKDFDANRGQNPPAREIWFMARPSTDIWLLFMHGDRRLDRACLLPRARVRDPVPASSMLGSTQSTSMLRACLSAPLDHLHSLEASQASFHKG